MIAAPPASARLTCDQRRRLAREFSGGVLRFDEPMSQHTSFRIGGPADALVMPRTLSEAQRIVALAIELGASLTVTGNGSNLLASRITLIRDVRR